MLFSDAVQELIEGRYVVRECWPEAKGYLVFMPGMTSIWAITTSPNVNAGNMLFSVEDYQAEDWILLQDRKSEVKPEEEKV